MRLEISTGEQDQAVSSLPFLLHACGRRVGRVFLTAPLDSMLLEYQLDTRPKNRLVGGAAPYLGDIKTWLMLTSHDIFQSAVLVCDSFVVA